MSDDKTHKAFVVGAGFGRTGTESLKLALDNLGYKCYHMHEIDKIGSKARSLWKEVSEMNTARRLSSGIWDRVFEDGYSACVDFPTTCYWSEIMQYYEWKTGLKAKVILTERNSAEQWYTSAIESIFPALDLVGSTGVIQFIPHLIPVFRGQFSGKLNNKEECMAEYRNHNAYVKRVVPSDQLLVLNLKRDSADGYRRLIDFLEVSDQNIIREFQDQPMPRVNTKADKARTVRNVKFVRNVVFPVLIALMLCVVAWITFRVFEYMNH